MQDLHRDVSKGRALLFRDKAEEYRRNCRRIRRTAVAAARHADVGGPIFRCALFSCYTGFVARNVTIRISDQAALWARRKAAEENTSVSRLVGEMLERQMRLTDDYWQAFEHWKANRPLAGSSAAQRMCREEVHERR